MHALKKSNNYKLQSWECPSIRSMLKQDSVETFHVLPDATVIYYYFHFTTDYYIKHIICELPSFFSSSNAKPAPIRYVQLS